MGLTTCRRWCVKSCSKVRIFFFLSIILYNSSTSHKLLEVFGVLIVPWFLLVPSAYNVAFAVAFTAVLIPKNECCLVLEEVTLHLREQSLEGDQLSLLSMDEASDVKLSFNALLTLVVFFMVVFPQTATFA